MLVASGVGFAVLPGVAQMADARSVAQRIGGLQQVRSFGTESTGGRVCRSPVPAGEFVCSNAGKVCLRVRPNAGTSASIDPHDGQGG